MTARKPQPRFGVVATKSMPEGYYYDFSYTHPLSHEGWTWQFNIPLDNFLGFKSPIRNQEITQKIWDLQVEHGCANVTSGNAEPLSPDHIGVYVGPNEGAHRDGDHADMCRCFG